MDNPLGNFTDEVGEVVKDVAKGIALEAKKQVVGKEGKNKDPVTGKPIPTKKALTQLSQATAQLVDMKMKKVREELEKQRLKRGNETAGPEVPKAKSLPKDDVIAQNIRNAKSTGEFGRQAGG